ncbi:MAG: ATP-binding protein [Lachnospiraceae bacterium]|nr:ATP-binding protein [Lachnospiraceae bacterium]
MIFNINKAFNESYRQTMINLNPQSVRDTFGIDHIFPNGIFKLEAIEGLCQYDRGYLFTDINYINNDADRKENILLALAGFLNSMSCDFKITVCNEYSDMNAFIDSIFDSKNLNQYPDIHRGMRQFIDEKIENAEMHDVKKVMYLTISTRAYSYDNARTFFMGMDVELINFFKVLGSSIYPLNGEQRLNILNRFFYPDREDRTFDFKNKYSDPLIDVIPTSLSSDTDYLLFNKKDYVSVLFAYSYASSLDESSALYSLSNTSYPSFVTIDYAPVEHSIFKEKLNKDYTNNDRAIAMEADSKYKNNQIMTGISFQKEKTKNELEGYMTQVEENDEECFLVGLVVVVTASSEAELSARVDSMIQTGKDKGIHLTTYDYVQMKAFNTALPIGTRLVKFKRAFLTSSLVSLQPFHAEDLIQKGGSFYGLNKTTNHLVIGNRKNLPSPHGMVVGHTGAGKSFFVKFTEIAQTLLCTDDDLFIIDPQNEFKKICMCYDGEFIDCTTQSNIYINPMEIPEEVLLSDDIKKEKFKTDVKEWLNSFINAVMSGMEFTKEYSTFISEACDRVYEKPFSEKRLKRQPTLVDIREKFKTMEDEKTNFNDKEIIHKMYNVLQDYTVGSFDMFAKETNIDLNNRFVCFGLKNVSETNWEPVMVSIMFFLANRMEYNQNLQRATRFVIDETQVVTRNDASAKMLLKAVVTFRKFGGICTMVMQNFSRALDNPELRDMYSNCGYKYFLDQGGMDANKIAEIQELSEIEFKSLSEAEAGKGVLVWGKDVILLDSIMSNKNVLYDVFSTNFHENAIG